MKWNHCLSVTVSQLALCTTRAGAETLGGGRCKKEQLDGSAPIGNTGGMKEHTETKLQRAIREANKRVQPIHQVQLVLVLAYSAAGKVVQVDGVCNGRSVLTLKGTGQADIDVGQAATETLRLGALGALLGS